jgi:hypothetical protein
MEVHHPHHPTHKKKWSEYIVEFVMLFAAVTLGYGAENIRHHYIEEKKTIANVQNLYKDLKNDSLAFSGMLEVRCKQDSCFNIISRLYDQKKLEQNIPTLYAAHSLIALRIMPVMNTMALDQIKNSGALNYIEDEKLKQEIQYYANNAAVLKTREQREYVFIDKYIDPLSITKFNYKYFQELSKFDSFEIKGDKVIAPIIAPEGLTLVDQNTFDWNNYLSVLGMLSTIKNSTDRSQIKPIQEDCIKLLGLIRKYLEENNALTEE